MAIDEHPLPPEDREPVLSPLPLPDDPPAGPRRSLPSWTPTAVFAALVLLIGAVVVVAGDPGPSGDDGEPLLRAEDAAESTDGLASGGPRDGLDSLGLPVQVSPAEGLADGQSVTVTGQGFPALTPLGVVMCTAYGPSAEGGVQNCQISPYTSVTTDADGSFSVEHRVARYVTLSNGVHDCAAPPPAGADRNCVVAVGAISDYDQSGTTPVTFDPDVPARPPLWVGIEPEGPVDEGDPLTVTITNADPGSTWWVDVCGFAEPEAAQGEPAHSVGTTLCRSGGSPYGACDASGSCTEPAPTGTRVVADAAGSATLVLPALTTIVVGDQVLDCRTATSWCEVVVRDDSGVHWYAFPVQFGGAPPPAPTMPPGTTGTTLSGSTETTVAATTATSVEVTSPPDTATSTETTSTSSP